MLADDITGGDGLSDAAKDGVTDGSDDGMVGSDSPAVGGSDAGTWESMPDDWMFELSFTMGD